jgi:hypothetical protein
MHWNPLAQARLTPLVLQLPRQEETLDPGRALPLFDLGPQAVQADAELGERHEQGRIEGAKEVAEVMLCLRVVQALWGVVLPKAGAREDTGQDFQNEGEPIAFMLSNDGPG